MTRIFIKQPLGEPRPNFTLRSRGVGLDRSGSITFLRRSLHRITRQETLALTLRVSLCISTFWIYLLLSPRLLLALSLLLLPLAFYFPSLLFSDGNMSFTHTWDQAGYEEGDGLFNTPECIEQDVGIALTIFLQQALCSLFWRCIDCTLRPST